MDLFKTDKKRGLLDKKEDLMRKGGECVCNNAGMFFFTASFAGFDSRGFFFFQPREMGSPHSVQ